MLRNKQHSRKEWPLVDGGPPTAGLSRADDDPRVPVLMEMIDSLDLHTFLHDQAYRRRLNEVLDAFTDEEFDRFERLYSRRFTLN